jgi:hypothetical protein
MCGYAFVLNHMGYLFMKRLTARPRISKYLLGVEFLMPEDVTLSSLYLKISIVVLGPLVPEDEVFTILRNVVHSLPVHTA